MTLAASAAPIAVQQFSTECTPRDHRESSFQRELQRLFSIGFALRSAPSRPLSARMSAYRGRHLRFADVAFSPHTTVSAGAVPRTDARLLVSLHREGPARVSQGGRESRVECGDIFIIDPARAFTIETGEIRSQSVYLQPSTLRLLVPELDQLTARPMPSDRGPGAIFRSAVDQMFALAPSWREDVADRVADALPYLLAPALAQLNAAGPAPASRLKAHHLQRIRRFVQDNLCDAELDAGAVAAAVRLSQRHVYDLFAEEPEPLMKWVWSERLNRCRRDLEVPALAARAIGEIAYAWGFRDVSHFCRSFKRRYGKTPSEWRREAGATNSPDGPPG